MAFDRCSSDAILNRSTEQVIKQTLPTPCLIWFLWADHHVCLRWHPPVRLEGCRVCHEVHGSANPRMMVRHEVLNLCLECHANLPVPNPPALGVVPPAFHDLRDPRFRNCTICHQKIHGSHVDRNFLR